VVGARFGRRAETSAGIDVAPQPLPDSGWQRREQRRTIHATLYRYIVLITSAPIRRYRRWQTA
jgi:hypothetical protein